MRTRNNALRALVTSLKGCPTQDDSCSPKLLIDLWERFRKLRPEEGEEVTASIIAGLVLYNQQAFPGLLNEAERSQLVALSQTALERYLTRAHPPNKLGKTIASAIKEIS